MTDHVVSQQHTKKLLPRLVVQCERPIQPTSGQIESDGPLQDANARAPGGKCLQAMTPPLPAGFNPYFDLPPV